MNPEETASMIREYVVAFGSKVLVALALWVAGRWLIGVAGRFIQRSLESQKVDPTVLRYVGSIINVALNIVLLIGILGYFGVETTSFAAIIAAAGVAIGMAWAGLLSNFAAGAFLMVLRPFKVGDFIHAAGVMGTVKELGLFATTVVTMDNVLTLVGNNAIFSGTIQNFTANPHRRVDLTCQLNGAVDVAEAVALLSREVAGIPNVLADPAPTIEILEFNLVGPVLAVRPHCHNDHYWQVYFDTNRVIRDAPMKAGFPSPMPAQTVFVKNT